MRAPVLAVARGDAMSSRRLFTSRTTVAVATIDEVDEVSSRCLQAALALGAPRTVAVHVHCAGRSADEKAVLRRWDAWDADVPLVTLWSPDGDVGVAVRDWVRRRLARHQVELFTSELRRRRSPGGVLAVHRHADELEVALATEPNVVVCRQLLMA